VGAIWKDRRQLLQQWGQWWGQFDKPESERKKDREHFCAKSLIYMVGVKGFEPSTPCTPCGFFANFRVLPCIVLDQYGLNKSL
jgi:hypothetical protein